MEWHERTRVGESVVLLLFCTCLVRRYSYLIGWITDTITPTVRQIVNVYLNNENNFLTTHILMSLWYNGMKILFRDCHHSSLSSQTPRWFGDIIQSCWPQGEACLWIPSPAIKSSQPPKHGRGKKVVNQAEADSIKSSNRCKDSPASASLSDWGFGRIWKSCHLISIQNACRSDAAHFIAVTMVL